MSCQVGGRGAGGVLFIQWSDGTVRTKIGMWSGGQGGRERGGEQGERRE